MDHQKEFFEAVLNNDFKKVKLLLKHPEVNPAHAEDFAIIQAAAHGYFDIFKLLFENLLTDPSAQLNEALILASKRGHTEVVKLLVTDQRINLIANNGIPLHYAYLFNYTDIVKILLSFKEVQEESSIISLLAEAINNNNSEIIEFVLNNIDIKPLIDHNYYYLLEKCIDKNNSNAFKLLTNHNKVDLSKITMIFVYKAFDNKNHNIQKILYKNKKIMETLKHNKPETFKEFYKKYKIVKNVNSFS
jgi:ankyrin repeat protein